MEDYITDIQRDPCFCCKVYIFLLPELDINNNYGSRSRENFFFFYPISIQFCTYTYSILSIYVYLHDDVFFILHC